MRLSVLTYNTFLLPTTVTSSGQTSRARCMAAGLRGHDVLILSEVFDERARECLLGRLALDYPHRTAFSVADVPWLDDGGLIVASKWPIRREDRRIVGLTDRSDDCFAMGLVYTEIELPGGRAHVFGSHAHAAGTPRSSLARKAQFRKLRAFVDAQNIPQGEPVIHAGDVNVDLSVPTADSIALLDTVGARFAAPRAEEAYTYDPQTNRLARGNARALRDYVLVSSTHRQPVEFGTAVMPLCSEQPWWGNVRDLSDHYGLWARLIYD